MLNQTSPVLGSKLARNSIEVATMERRGELSKELSSLARETAKVEKDISSCNAQYRRLWESAETDEPEKEARRKSDMRAITEIIQQRSERLLELKMREQDLLRRSGFPGLQV